MRQWAGHRALVPGRASELHAFWLAVRRDLNRARRRVLPSSRFKAHAADEPRPSSSRGHPEGPSNDEDPPDPTRDIDRFSGDIPGDFRGSRFGLRRRDAVQQDLLEHALRGFAGGRPEFRPKAGGSRLFRPDPDDEPASCSDSMGEPAAAVPRAIEPRIMDDVTRLPRHGFCPIPPRPPAPPPRPFRNHVRFPSAEDTANFIPFVLTGAPSGLGVLAPRALGTVLLQGSCRIPPRPQSALLRAHRNGVAVADDRVSTTRRIPLRERRSPVSPLRRPGGATRSSAPASPHLVLLPPRRSPPLPLHPQLPLLKTRSSRPYGGSAGLQHPSSGRPSQSSIPHSDCMASVRVVGAQWR